MRIAIVNDLALAREVLRRLVHSLSQHSIAWIAENGEEAVQKAAADTPDVILMDLIMPVMDGVEATRRIMKSHPCPILLVTSSVTGNYNQVFAAMGHGGLDAVNTPTLGPDGKLRDAAGLIARIEKLSRSLATTESKVVASLGASRFDSSDSGISEKLPSLVVLGASTGGPDAVAQVLGRLPADLPAAVIIVQHIAEDFVPGLAQWLQSRTKLSVTLAQANDVPRVGVAYLAATDGHLILRSGGAFEYSAEPVALPYRPSVDVFMKSAARVAATPGCAALLTGMGSDGARGLLALRQRGWHTIAQDQATSIVFGMPKAAQALGAASEILPLERIGPAIAARFRNARMS